MLLSGGFLFIVLLIFLLIMLYKNERLFGKSLRARAVIEEYWDGKNRRKHMRFSKTLDIIYTLEKKHHLKNSARTVNISEGGAKLLLDKKLSKGSILDLTLELPNTNKVTEIESRVVWSEEVKDADSSGKRLFHTGIEFFAIKEPPGMPFINYIRSLADDS